jgi:hypothetical protein
MITKGSIFWDITGSTCYMLHDGFLVGLFLDPEDGGDILLWKVGSFSTDYIVSYPRRQNSSTYSLHAESEWTAL